MPKPIFVINKNIPDEIESTAEAVDFIADCLLEDYGITEIVNVDDNTIYGKTYQIVVNSYANDTHHTMTMYSYKPLKKGAELKLKQMMNRIYDTAVKIYGSDSDSESDSGSESDSSDDSESCSNSKTSKCKLCNCEFSNCEFSNYEFSNCKFSNCKFSNCKFSNCKFV